MEQKICPLCKKSCNEVSRSQVFKSIKKHFQVHLKSEQYGYCSNPDCDIVYFGIDTDEMYFKRDFIDVIKE